MSNTLEPSANAGAPAAPPSAWRELLVKEDWWAIWIGIGLVAVAAILASHGGSLKWLAVAPTKWSHPSEAIAQFAAHAPQYLALYALWLIVFGIGASALGYGVGGFAATFTLVYGVSIVLYFLGQWDQSAHYNLEPPLFALALGLIVSNTVGVPKWADGGLRVEFYIKTGIVLLGAGVPLALLAWAGPVAILQAAIVSIVTFTVIYFTGVKLGLDKRLAATLGTGGAVCGVSGAIATAGAVGARREDASIAISLVVFWAIVTVFVLPLVSRSLSLPTGVAGAWIGTSEFADAAGLAAAQTYGGYAGHVPGISGNADASVNAFTLMKVIGRDVWIGVWAFVLSIVATTRWESTGVKAKPNAGEIWRRFPKFVLGFLIASAIITVLANGFSYAEYKKVIQPSVVAPLQALRTWAFIFAFLSIGLTTRIRDFVRIGGAPFYAFTAGVVVNLILGFVLSTRVFVDFWLALGE